jgi:hypothetical protein
MKTRLAAAGAILLVVGRPAFAHRLDEYLQATTIAVEKGRVRAQVRLTPGVAVFPAVLARIDADRDGSISDAERRGYGQRVLRDLSLTVDGEPVPLRLVSSTAAKIEEMREGRGSIELDLDAEVPRRGPHRRLAFENHHESRISAYLVNCLVPDDPDIQVTGQDRNYEQSSYRLDYLEAGGRSSSWPLARWAVVRWLGSAAFVLVAGLALTGRGRARPAEE